MERTLIFDLKERIEKEVTICAWVSVARNQGKIAFFDFRDRSGSVQGIVFDKPAVLEVAQTLHAQWTVTITGVVHARPEKMVKVGVQNGDIEIEITGIEVLAKAEPLPFELDADFNLDTLLDNRPLTLRRARDRAIFKVQHEILAAFRAFLTVNSFIEFRAPGLVGRDAEGGASVFSVDYFNGHSAYLATSPQLYKQMLVGVYERVFAVANVFRGERHSTTRHLNEYTSLDFEMGFINGPEDVMLLESNLLRFITEQLKERTAEEFKMLGAEFPLIPEAGMFPSMKLTDAQALITKETGVDCTQEPDLEPEHERWLSEYAKKEFASDFIYITNYPKAKRPFYAMDDPLIPNRTKCFDLLFRGLELVSGNQRIHEYEPLIEKMKWKGLNPDNFAFYLQAFKYGMPPHGGLGMGLERLTARFLGLANVKEASLFPRDINRIDTLLHEVTTPTSK